MQVLGNSFELAGKILLPSLPCKELSLGCASTYVTQAVSSAWHTIGFAPLLGVTPGLNARTVIQLVGNYFYSPYLIRGIMGAGFHGLSMFSALRRSPLLLRSTPDPDAALARGEAAGLRRAQQPIGEALWRAVSAQCNNGGAQTLLHSRLPLLTADQIDRLGNGALTNPDIKRMLSTTNDLVVADIRTAFTQAKTGMETEQWNALITQWRSLDEQKERNAIDERALQLARSPADVVSRGRRIKMVTQLFWTAAYLLSGVSTAMYQIGVQAKQQLNVELVGDASSEVLKQCAEQGGIAWILNTPGVSWITTTTTSLCGYAVSWLPLLIFAHREYQSISGGELNLLAQIKQKSFWGKLASRAHWYAVAALSYQMYGTEWLTAGIGSVIQYTGLWSHLEATEVGAWVATVALVGLAVRRIFTANDLGRSLGVIGELGSVMQLGVMTRTASQGFQWLARSVTHGWYCTMAQATFG